MLLGTFHFVSATSSTFTLRPDIKLFVRSGALVVGAELGLDFLIATKDETALDIGGSFKLRS